MFIIVVIKFSTNVTEWSSCRSAANTDTLKKYSILLASGRQIYRLFLQWKRFFASVGSYCADQEIALS